MYERIFDISKMIAKIDIMILYRKSLINDHFKQRFGRIFHFEKTHEERSGKKSCCTKYLSSFVLASACLQNPCGLE